MNNWALIQNHMNKKCNHWALEFPSNPLEEERIQGTTNGGTRVDSRKEKIFYAYTHNIHMYPYFLFAAIHHLNRPRLSLSDLVAQSAE